MTEPIVHFVILGAFVFGLDLLLNRSEVKLSTIAVGQSEQSTIVELYRSGRGRDPTPQEMNEQIERWIDAEILYREGLSLGLDRGDEEIRQRVIANTLGMIKSSVTTKDSDDLNLKSWLKTHRKNYHIVLEGSIQ